MTSSNDESLCQHIVPNADPNSLAGSDIVIKHNGVNVTTMPAAFTEFEYCFDMDDINIANDEFQLQSSSEDGVCITSLSINSNQLFVGKNNNGISRIINSELTNIGFWIPSVAPPRVVLRLLASGIQQ